MIERPILFSGPMVRAILEGRKTQTRRVVRFDTASGYIVERGGKRRWHRDDPEAVQACPLGASGDALWVRETFSSHGRHGEPCSPRDAVMVVLRDFTQVYRDGQIVAPLSAYADGAGGNLRWRPSIHMPRWASRLSLPLVRVRVERLQDISEADCCAEGVGSPITRDLKRPQFAALWDSINGKSHPWVSNPKVWVLEFERVGGAA